MQPTGARRRSALAAAVVLFVGVVAVALVVLASAGGSVRPISETTITRTPDTAGPPTTTPSLSVPSGIGAPADGEQRPFELPPWLAALWQAAVYATGTLLALFLLRALYRLVRKVRLPEAEENSADDWERIKADRLSEAVEAGLDAVDTGTPTDAVIACWVALEEAAAAAGVARAAAETPAEFTVRVLGVGGISEPELTRLAELYREARYSSHGSTEAARARARSALMLVRDELARVREERTRLREELAAARSSETAEDRTGSRISTAARWGDEE